MTENIKNTLEYEIGQQIADAAEAYLKCWNEFGDNYPQACDALCTAVDRLVELEVEEPKGLPIVPTVHGQPYPANWPVFRDPRNPRHCEWTQAPIKEKG